MSPDGFGRVSCGIHVCKGIHHFLRKRKGTDVKIQIFDEIREFVIIFVADDLFHKLEEVVVALCIVPIQNVVDTFITKYLQLGIVGYAKIGSDVQFVEILPHQLAAKGIYRADRSFFYQYHLAAHAAVPRILLQLFLKLRRDTLFHFGSGSSCKGYYQKSVSITVSRRVVAGQLLYHSLHQHGCLAGAGGCRNKQRASRSVDRASLPQRPYSLTHRFPPA